MRGGVVGAADGAKWLIRKEKRLGRGRLEGVR
jgi:hypothetical protein